VFETPTIRALLEASSQDPRRGIFVGAEHSGFCSKTCALNELVSLVIAGGKPIARFSPAVVRPVAGSGRGTALGLRHRGRVNTAS
jgi:hypothetical protein